MLHQLGRGYPVCKYIQAIKIFYVMSHMICYDCGKVFVMPRYPLNLPLELKRKAEQWASEQGVSLNKFIMWAVAKKVGALNQGLDDPSFPLITYRRGAPGIPIPFVRGTRIRVQTLVMAKTFWESTPSEIAENYDLTEKQVQEALDFYTAHQQEIDLTIAHEQTLETNRV